MSGEFEIVIPVEGSKYGDCVIVQKYGDQYKLLAGTIPQKADATPWLRWVFPQDKDKKPREKAIPLQINLGNLTEARSILTQLLASLPGGVQPSHRPKPSDDQEDGSSPF